MEVDEAAELVLYVSGAYVVGVCVHVYEGRALAPI